MKLGEISVFYLKGDTLSFSLLLQVYCDSRYFHGPFIGQMNYSVSLTLCISVFGRKTTS